MNMVLNIPSVVSKHYKAGNIKWTSSICMLIIHSLALAALGRLPQCSKETLVFAYLLWPISGFGITVGVHRLWSHRSYEAGFIARVLLMFMNCIANQGSIYDWCRDHRVHHKYSETDADPHNAKRGFFFAHMGWLFVKKHPDVGKAGKELDFSDLEADGVVMFQKKFNPWLQMYMCFIFPAQIASYFWGENFWNAFYVAGALRYVFVLHCTYCVNSAAHLYGDHPYDTTSFPAENSFVSWCAVGEGWHNWHHKYPFDYAASELGISSQFNPSKLFIDLMASFGLVWGRKRATLAWEMGKERRDRERANGIVPEKLQKHQ